MEIENVLDQRLHTHGRFCNNARISQQLKAILHAQGTWLQQDFEVREALDLICCKMSRILSGNKNEEDNWVDIIGYSTLAHDHIVESKKFQRELYKEGHYL